MEQDRIRNVGGFLENPKLKGHHSQHTHRIHQFSLNSANHKNNMLKSALNDNWNLYVRLKNLTKICFVEGS